MNRVITKLFECLRSGSGVPSEEVMVLAGETRLAALGLCFPLAMSLSKATAKLLCLTVFKPHSDARSQLIFPAALWGRCRVSFVLRRFCFLLWGCTLLSAMGQPHGQHCVCFPFLHKIMSSWNPLNATLSVAEEQAGKAGSPVRGEARN